MDIQQKLEYILKEKFHLQQFKNQQLESIIELVKCPPSDVFCIFPTSAGKSLIYQVATVYLNKTTLIISPLTALMQDQVIKLQQLGFRAFTYISDYSINTKLDVQKAIQDNDKIEFLFTTPEQIDSQYFKELITKINIGLVCVDECHVIFDWGQDFRRSLRKLYVLRDLIPYAPMLALTASVTYQSAKMIINQLKMRQPKVFIQSFNRSNIFYASCLIQPVNMDKNELLIGILQSFINQYPSRSIIIYTFTKKEAENLENILTNYEILCRYYHSEVNKDEKKDILDKWQQDELKVIIATKAFSMGIDKSSVGLVIHYTLPVSMEDFYQESGRAGRDGIQSYSIVLTDQKDIMTRKQQQDRYVQLEQKISFYYMLKFLFDQSCKRKTLLKYFNSGVNDNLEKQQICCDFCQYMRKNQNPGQKMFYNHLFGYQTHEEISSEHILDQIRFYRKECPLVPLMQLNSNNDLLPQQANNQSQEQQNDDQNVQQMEAQQLKHEIKKIIIVACKKKMKEHAPHDLIDKIDRLALIIIQKGDNNKEKMYQCAKKIEKYIENKKGCFSYQELIGQVSMYFT